MAGPHRSSLVNSLAQLLRNDGDLVLDGSSTLTLPAGRLQQLTRLFELYLLSRNQQHGFLALPSHPADTASLLQLQFLFDVLQKTISLKIINPSGARLQSVVKIFPFKSLKYLELKRVPPHCLKGLRGVYSQLEVFTCSQSLSSLEELLSLCGGDLSSALPWLELHTLNFSYNSIVCLDQSLSLLNMLRLLDLSHNRIKDCAEFLKPLTELEHLNLGYNCLQRAPTLGLSARAKLQTLILRNNELETINGVEQLSSLQHLDLAYNLLLEHSQLAPLSLLHCLNSLNLEGNPLYFQRTHRTCTVRHLSPKAVGVRFKLDGVRLSSSELSVLPRPGQQIVQVQTPSPGSLPRERSNQDVSSGAGELSDSQSVGEVVASRIRRKKTKNKVKVRQASISEASDTDYEARRSSSRLDVVLPHQQEIERMSSFREQLGEDWLRYQHHLEGEPSAVTASQPQTLADGLPPPLLCSELNGESSDADQETESTLQWPSQTRLHTESTLEDSLLDRQRGGSSCGGSPESQRATKEEEEEEEDLGVDQCLPLLVGVMSDQEDVDGLGERRRRRREVFLCVKQRLLLELDVQHGQERRRMELDSLTAVETSEAAWTRGEVEERLPSLELCFDYISEEKRRRRYVLLDDDPQQAMQALINLLRPAVEENIRRDCALRPSCVSLQCLCCRSEFSAEGDGGGRVRRRAEGAEERDDEELTERGADRDGNTDVCPQCGSDHVVQLMGQSAPHSSTPVHGASTPDSGGDGLHPSATKDGHSDASGSSSSVLDAATLREDQVESWDLSYGTDCQSKEGLAGSYRYGAISATPPTARIPLDDDRLCADDLLEEVYEAVDHRLKLFLDVEVFEEEEELHAVLKMSAVRFGEPDEVPSVLVVSDKRIYLLEVTSDNNPGQLSDWLQTKDSHPILELSYLEVGLASQSIHMAFGGVAYTLLVRDSLRCKRFFGRLTGIVREMAHRSDSKLQSISTARLDPQHHLWPLVCADEQADVVDGQLQFFYLLAFVLQGGVWTPLTVLATRETLHLLKEDHQWRKSCGDGSREPASGGFTLLEALAISCVSSVHVWPPDERRLDLKLYDETVKQERTWCVRSDSAELLQGLLAWVRERWEAMFGVRLSTSLQDQR